VEFTYTEEQLEKFIATECEQEDAAMARLPEVGSEAYMNRDYSGA
jgi:hypothetical protein